MASFTQADILKEFDKINIHVNTLEIAVSRMYTFALEHNALEFFYLNAAIALTSCYNTSEVESSILQFAHFDSVHECPNVKRSALSFLGNTKFAKNKQEFIQHVNIYGMAGFKTTSGLLYVAHRCTKPQSKEWQLTIFAEGRGPISDSQFDTLEQIVEDGAVGAGIPPTATLVRSSELLALSADFIAAA